MPKVIFCMAVVGAPHPKTVESIEASVPLLEAAGWEHGIAQEFNNPYISFARAELIWKAFDNGADVAFMVDHDMEWEPEALMKVLNTEGDVVVGTYRYKKEEEEYMGFINLDHKNSPICREDGCVSAYGVPPGFMKITKAAVQRSMKANPELLYGDPLRPRMDLFQHGAKDWLWWGEDYSFSQRYVKAGGELWIVPNVNVNHYNMQTGECFKGNFHEYLMRITHHEEKSHEEKCEKGCKKLHGEQKCLCKNE